MQKLLADLRSFCVFRYFLAFTDPAIWDYKLMFKHLKYFLFPRTKLRFWPLLAILIISAIYHTLVTFFSDIV